jgi:hypothetical protein
MFSPSYFGAVVGSGIRNPRSEIRDKHPGSATQHGGREDFISAPQPLLKTYRLIPLSVKLISADGIFKLIP